MLANETNAMLGSIGDALDAANDLAATTADPIAKERLDDIVKALHRAFFVSCKLANDLREQSAKRRRERCNG